jgi:CRISPR-associated protein Cas2
MFIVSYDFESNRRRTKFSKFLKKFGRRIQYSIFEIKNSARVLRNISTEVEKIYEPHFTNADSILIMHLCETCKGKVKRYGYAANEEEEVVVFE